MKDILIGCILVAIPISFIVHFALEYCEYDTLIEWLKFILGGLILFLLLACFTIGGLLIIKGIFV